MTGDGEVSKKLVRVGSIQPVYQVDILEFGANDGRQISGFELVEDAAQLQGL